MENAERAASEKNKGEETKVAQKPQEKAVDIDEEELERQAVEALLEDARRGKARAENVGAMGWVKQRQVNKRFLNSVVLQTVSRQTKRKHLDRERRGPGWTKEDRESTGRTSKREGKRSRGMEYQDTHEHGHKRSRKEEREISKV